MFGLRRRIGSGGAWKPGTDQSRPKPGESEFADSWSGKFKSGKFNPRD